jgi:hypothetical protein
MACAQIRGEGDDAGMLHSSRGSTADPGAGPGDNHSPAGEIDSRLLPSHRHPFIRCSWNIE